MASTVPRVMDHCAPTPGHSGPKFYKRYILNMYQMQRDMKLLYSHNILNIFTYIHAKLQVYSMNIT